MDLQGTEQFLYLYRNHSQPMRFLYQPFEAKRKEIIEVEIDQSTKVKFMTAREFKSYKMGKTYHQTLTLPEPKSYLLPFRTLHRSTHFQSRQYHADRDMLRG